MYIYIYTYIGAGAACLVERAGLHRLRRLFRKCVQRGRNKLNLSHVRRGLTLFALLSLFRALLLPRRVAPFAQQRDQARQRGRHLCTCGGQQFTEIKKQSPNTGARANNTLHKQLGYHIGWRTRKQYTTQVTRLPHRGAC